MLRKLGAQTETQLGGKMNQSEGQYSRGGAPVHLSTPFELNETYAAQMHAAIAIATLNMSQHHGYSKLTHSP